MDIYTKDGQIIMCLPDSALCKVAGKSPHDMDKCPLGFDKYDDCMCIPELCNEYEEGEPTPHYEDHKT